MKDFNINSYVGVKLTYTGLRILEMQHNEQLRRMSPEATKLVGDFQAPPVDEERYSQMQLYQLMNSFGQYMVAGNPNPPFEMDIKISDEYLNEHISNKSKSM